jgi:hypothetical protein
MNDVLRFHSLRWIRVNSDHRVEEFIDTTRNYFKVVWADGYTEITKLHAIHTGNAIKEPTISLISSIYKSPKIRYNISVRNKREASKRYKNEIHKSH